MSILDQVRVFLRVAELSSFTAAADSLGLPKASVSTAVQQLEAQLGTRLLHRTTRRVSLSPDGQLFRERARDLVHDLDELTALFQPDGGPLRGRLRVDMPIGVARDVIIPALPELLAEHPDLELELSSTDRLVDLVREGFDCVLRVGQVLDAARMGLMVRAVGQYPVVNCVSRGYAEIHGQPRSLAELGGHRLVQYVPSNFGGPADEFEYLDPDTHEPRSISLARSITVNNSTAYLAACQAGLGIIQIPLAPVRALLDAGELIEILPTYRSAPMPVSLLHPHGRQVPRRLRVFMDWVAARLAPHC